jgi:HlyD family secretion protein
MIKNKKKIIITILVVLLIFSIYQAFFKKSKKELNLAEVERGTIIQEVSETGAVKKGDEISLNFKNSGQIEKIYVKVGDNIEAGQKLAKLNTTQLYLQLKEANANLDIAEAQEAERHQELKDVTAQAEESLNEAYKSALSVLDDSYLKIYNALTFVNYLRDAYFNMGDTPSINVYEAKLKIERAFNDSETNLDLAKNASKNEDIDLSISNIIEDLSDTEAGLEIIRNAVEEIPYKSIFSSTDKSTLDTHKLNINTDYSNLISAQQNISATKTNNQAKINAVQIELSERNGTSLSQAQINAAESQVQLLEQQIADATLKSPTDGQVTQIDKREGELVQPTSQEGVISILPDVAFEITVDIYEGDIVKVEIGNPVDIELTAFPDQTLSGKVIFLDPAQKLIDGVIYYEVTIDFQDMPENLKPGMTADITIKTAQKDNILIIPGSAISEKDGKKLVQVSKNGNNLEERQIETGIQGNDNMVEVISGLEAGEKVVVSQ